MNKPLNYIGMLALALGLASCTEDYTDWAAPQSHPQEPFAGKLSAVIAIGQDAVIDKATAPDTAHILVFQGFTDSTVTAAQVKNVFVNGRYALPFTQSGTDIAVATAQLDSAVRVALQSQACVERELALSVEAVGSTAEGEAFSATSNEVTLKYTPGATPELESAYYLVGDFNSWTLDKSVPLADKGNGLFQATVTVPANCYWKIFGESAIDAQDWSQALGCAVNGSTATSDFVSWNQGSEVQSMMIGQAGEYVITFDAVNFRYTVAPKVDELYFTGSYYNWGDTWNALVPVYGQEGVYWTLLYADAGEQLKFAPQADWGNDFAGTVASDAAGAGAAVEGGNLVIAKAGWYLLYVSAGTQEVEIYAPDIYMIGDCVGGWDEDVAAHKFTVPTSRDGDFVSPVFTGNGDMRMYVRPKATLSWWNAEFTVLDGKIAFRGNGGDQERAAAAAGQTLHLNFTAGTGTLE